MSEQPVQYAGLIRDKSLNKRFQCIFKSASMYSEYNEVLPYYMYINLAAANINSYVQGKEQFNANDFNKFVHEELLMAFYSQELSKEKPSIGNFNHDYDKYLLSDERKKFLSSSMQYIEHLKNKPDWFEEYINFFEQTISPEQVEYTISSQCQNDFLRGGTTTFIQPGTQIENSELRKLQGEMFARYNAYFHEKSLISGNGELSITSFEPTELEAEYKYLFAAKQKIIEISQQPDLSESDKAYCTQALKDIESFVGYLSAQMTTIVSLEPQARMQDVAEFQIQIAEYLQDLDPDDESHMNKLLFTLDATSLKEASALFQTASENERSQVAQKIYLAILSSEKSVELSCRDLDSGKVNMTIISERGKIDAVPFDINSRFRNLLKQPFEIVQARSEFPVAAHVMENLATQLQQVESQIQKKRAEIEKIGGAILPSTKKQKAKLESELNVLEKQKTNLTELIPAIYQRCKSNEGDFSQTNEFFMEFSKKPLLKGKPNSLIQLAQTFINDLSGLLMINVNELMSSNMSDKRKRELLQDLNELSQMCPTGAFPMEIHKLLMEEPSQPYLPVEKFNNLSRLIKTSTPLRKLAEINRREQQQQQRQQQQKA